MTCLHAGFCAAILVMAAVSLVSCSSDTVRCRKVSAAEFMRIHHDFKGMKSDAFIGTAEGKAFKEIARFGLLDSWEILWTPAALLPPAYLRTAKEKETGYSKLHLFPFPTARDRLHPIAHPRP